jgi:ABC-type transport system involved in cytochrome c biogenesis permease subunit
MLGYVVMAIAAVHAAAVLVGPAANRPAAERAMASAAGLGLPLLTAGLLLGAVWGKLAWGRWWNWDPKELTSLATWLVYVGFFHLRAAWGPKRPRLNAAVILLGTAGIVLTMTVVNLSRAFAGLHSYAR